MQAHGQGISNYSITRRQDGQHRQGGRLGGGRVVSRRRLQLAPVPDGALDTRLGPASHPPPLPGLPSTLASVCLFVFSACPRIIMYLINLRPL